MNTRYLILAHTRPGELARLIGARAVLVPYSAFDDDVLGSLFGLVQGPTISVMITTRRTASSIRSGPSVFYSN